MVLGFRINVGSLVFGIRQRGKMNGKWQVERVLELVG